MNWDEYYDDLEKSVKNRYEGKTHGWQQWKGTDICIDIYCVCGYQSHFDGYFLYYWECPSCGKIYALNPYVEFVELTKKQETYVRNNCELSIKGGPMDENYLKEIVDGDTQ